MKVALVWPNITTLGVDSKYYNAQAFGLARELSKLGHEVVILTSDLFMDKDLKTTKSSRVYARSYDNFNIVYMPGYASQRYPLMPNLFKELTKFNPDVVQSAEDISPATLISLMYSKLKGAPLLVYQGIYEHAVSSPFIS